MLSIFIPQETLEDIVIDNMASDIEPEEQDTWFKIFTKQDIIYVSLLDEKDYITEKDLLFRLTKSYGVKIKNATNYINAIPAQPGSVTKYWNGIFLLNISEDDAAAIQRDYGVICQSVDCMDASVLMDPDLRFSLKKDETGYSWDLMLHNISAEHIPSNHLILIDRYLLVRDDDKKGKKKGKKAKKQEEDEKKEEENELNFILHNLYDIMNTMLPVDELKCRYKVTIIVGEPKEGFSFSISDVSKNIQDELIPSLERLYDIDVEILYLTHLSGLYTATHNRCILTNYTVTQVEHMIKAFDGGRSTCLQTIMPQGLFTSSGLDGYCDSPLKTHHDVTKAIYDNLVWWVKNFLTTKSTYYFNGKETNVRDRYAIKNNRLTTI